MVLQAAFAALTEWKLLPIFVENATPARTTIVPSVKVVRTKQIVQKAVIHPAIYAAAYNMLMPKGR